MKAVTELCWKDSGFCHWLNQQRPATWSRSSCCSLLLWGKTKSRRGYEFEERDGIWTNNLPGSRWKVGAVGRREEQGTVTLKLSQHKVSERLSEGMGECWQAEAVTEAEHFSMLYQTRDFPRNIQLCSVLATLQSPKWKPCFMKPEWDWHWGLQAT